MVITSRKNETVKDIRRLRRCKGDHALLEGPHLIGEALDRGLPLTAVLMTPSFLQREAGRRLAERLPRPPLEVAEDILQQLTDSDAPRGALAVATLPRSGVDALPRRRDGVYLYLDGVQDPGNLGALSRVAEAAGAAGLALAPGCAWANHPRALRASAGSLLRLPVAVEVTIETLERCLAPLAPSWLALSPTGGDDLYTASLDGPLVLCLGAEGPGLSGDTLARSSRRLTIPVQPPVESLNVTVAAALVLFEVARRRRG